MNLHQEIEAAVVLFPDSKEGPASGERTAKTRSCADCPGERVLAALPGGSERERVLLVLCQCADGSRMELRQQSYGAGVGWFTQTTIALASEQVDELRYALSASTQAIKKQARQERALQNAGPVAGLKVVRADSA